MEYYPRILEEKLDKWINKPEIIAIKGPRQAGKTTLLMYLREKYGGTYITFENDEYRESFEKDPVMFIKSFGEKFVYLDEVQYIKNIGKKLKLIYDTLPDVKLVVTGSGSFEIKDSIGRFLVGRIVYFELFPLNFEEYLLWKSKRLHRVFTEYKKAFHNFIHRKEWNQNIIFYEEFKKHLNEYIKWGGYPRIVKESNDEMKKELLKNLTSTYLEKDIFFFLGIKNLEKYRAFMKYLASTVGSIINLSNISMSLHIDYKTLINYLDLLKHTYIIKELSPFHKSLVTELRKPKKIYFYDLGIRNILLNNFSDLDERQDRGIILENFVYNELRNYDLYYWRTTGKAEVDFIMPVGEDIIPLEVKSISPKLTRSFKAFINAYNPQKGIWFQLGDCGDILEEKGTRILKIPHFVV